MSDHLVNEDRIYRFYLNQIDSVPHLEGLLLIWSSRPSPWTPEQLAERLFISRNAAENILQDLARRRLISTLTGPPAQYHYDSDGDEKDRLVQAAATHYRGNLIAVSNFIHSKPGSAIREFARAFRFIKERD